jgi:hypothetical protein
MALNRYTLTLEGADRPGGVGDPQSVTVWTLGLKPIPIPIGDARENTGLITNDSGLLKWSYPADLIGFNLSATTGHNNALFLKLFADVIGRPYKRITAVTGMDIIGSDNVTQFFAQQLTRYPGGIPVHIPSFTIKYANDNEVDVSLVIHHRYPGLK